MNEPQERRLILASGSRYRRALLSRLGLPFSVVPPGLDESRLDGESPPALAARLASSKGAHVLAAHAGATVIGSDQVAALGDTVLGKPGTRDGAREQLMACSASEVVFHTAVWVGNDEDCSTHIDRTVVRFRPLESATVDAYLDREPAFDCAGGFKIEGLGVSLFERVVSEDPTALIGLPLIWIAHALRGFGFRIP